MIDIARTKEIFMSLSLHLSLVTYDYFKYGSRVKNAEYKETEFWFRTLAGKLKTEENARDFFLANLIESFLNNGLIERTAIHFNNKESFEIWKQYKIKHNKLTYTFKQEIKALNIPIKDLVAINKGSNPQVFQYLIQQKVSIETFSLLIKHMPKLPKYWKDNSNDQFLLPEYAKVGKKYGSFLSVDKKTIKDILKEI